MIWGAMAVWASGFIVGAIIMHAICTDRWLRDESPPPPFSKRERKMRKP